MSCKLHDDGQHAYRCMHAPTLSRGIRRSSWPCFRNTDPASCFVDTPNPSAMRQERVNQCCRHMFWHVQGSPFVMIALVSNLTLNCNDCRHTQHTLSSDGRVGTCDAANLTTARKGAFSGTLIILKGSFGSEAKMILNDTLPLAFFSLSLIWTDGGALAGGDSEAEKFSGQIHSRTRILSRKSE